MGQIGNSLDNREVEYFFVCLKGEYLNKNKNNKNENQRNLKTYKLIY